MSFRVSLLSFGTLDKPKHCVTLFLVHYVVPTSKKSASGCLKFLFISLTIAPLKLIVVLETPGKHGMSQISC